MNNKHTNKHTNKQTRMDPINTRRGWDGACRNLTMPQLVKTSADHLKCLLKEDIIKLCRFHDISFELLRSKGFLITCIKDDIYCKKLKIKNLCDHKVYLNISTEYPGIFGFDDEEDIIDPHDYQLYSFDEDDDKSIVISKDKPTVYEEGTYVAFEYKKITNILYERNISEINDDTIVIKPINDESQWKTATLKLNFLMNELKRLGADKHETYSCIIDLHQDIVIPHDKE